MGRILTEIRNDSEAAGLGMDRDRVFASVTLLIENTLDGTEESGTSMSFDNWTVLRQVSIMSRCGIGKVIPVMEPQSVADLMGKLSDEHW